MKNIIAYSVERIVNRKNLPAIRCPLSAKNGFTLIEVILTITILSIGLISILRAYMTSINALDVAQENIEAVCLLKDKISQVEREEKEEGGLQAQSSSGRFSGGFENYIWNVNICRLPEEEISEATVTVYRDRHTRRYSLTTYVDNKEE